MRLIIKPDGMRIITETVQDVAYLKQIGYLSENPEVYMKVTVSKTKPVVLSRFGVEVENTDAPKEGAEIDICWEDINCGREWGSERADETREELVQHLEGPRLKFVKKASGMKASS